MRQTLQSLLSPVYAETSNTGVTDQQPSLKHIDQIVIKNSLHDRPKTSGRYKVGERVTSPIGATVYESNIFSQSKETTQTKLTEQEKPITVDFDAFESLARSKHQRP